MQDIEQIDWRGEPLAMIIRSHYEPRETQFLTAPEHKQQVGFVVHPAGHEIPPHSHRKIERNLVGTSEVLVVRRGRCEIDIFAEDRTLVRTCELRRGDIMLMIAGGHSFRMLEDTVFLEVKQGPYFGEDEKELYS